MFSGTIGRSDQRPHPGRQVCFPGFFFISVAPSGLRSKGWCSYPRLYGWITKYDPFRVCMAPKVLHMNNPRLTPGVREYLPPISALKGWHRT